MIFFNQKQNTMNITIQPLNPIEYQDVVVNPDNSNSLIFSPHAISAPNFTILELDDEYYSSSTSYYSQNTIKKINQQRPILNILLDFGDKKGDNISELRSPCQESTMTQSEIEDNRTEQEIFDYKMKKLMARWEKTTCKKSTKPKPS